MNNAQDGEAGVVCSAQFGDVGSIPTLEHWRKRAIVSWPHTGAKRRTVKHGWKHPTNHSGGGIITRQSQVLTGAMVTLGDAEPQRRRSE